VIGEPETRSGERFAVHERYPDDREPGHYLGDLEGAWQGDRITVRTRYTTWKADGTVVSRTTDASRLTFDLRRAPEAEFDRSCPS
jgi:hypothetical protein